MTSINSFISVIIPTYKDWPRLKLCLDALAQQTYPQYQFEVIVVNNDPEESCPYALPATNMKIITEKKPGSYAARNAGIRIAQGEVLGFTDSDCIPAEDWIEQAVNQLKLNTEVDLIAGSVKIFDVPENPSYINKFEKIFALRQDKYAKKNKAATANLITKKRVFDSIGLFDDSLLSGGDHEWTIRAFNAGHKITYSLSCHVLHPARTKSQLFIKTKRMFPKYLEVNAPYKSTLFLFLYGVFIVRPPLKYIRTIYNNKTIHSLTYKDMANMFLLFYKIRFIRFKIHYSLIFGGKRERQ